MSEWMVSVGVKALVKQIVIQLHVKSHLSCIIPEFSTQNHLPSPNSQGYIEAFACPLFTLSNTLYMDIIDLDSAKHMVFKTEWAIISPLSFKAIYTPVPLLCSPGHSVIGHTACHSSCEQNQIEILSIYLKSLQVSISLISTYG